MQDDCFGPQHKKVVFRSKQLNVPGDLAGSLLPCNT